MRPVAWIVAASLLGAPAIARSQQGGLQSGLLQAALSSCSPRAITRDQAELALAIAPMADAVRARLFSSVTAPNVADCATQVHRQICSAELVAAIGQSLTAGRPGGGLFDVIDAAGGGAPGSFPNASNPAGLALGAGGAILGGIAGSNRGLGGMVMGGVVGGAGGAAAGNALGSAHAATTCTRRKARMDAASMQMAGAPAAANGAAVVAWIAAQRVPPPHREGLQDLHAAAGTLRGSAAGLQARLSR